MFTVCPKCALTLVVTAADLRIAQGYVRCGRCLNVFNALARLSEERPAAAPEPSPQSPAPEPPEPGEQSAAAAEPAAKSSALEETGEIEIELDASALASSAAPAAPPPPTPAEAEPQSVTPAAQAAPVEPASVTADWGAESAPSEDVTEIGSEATRGEPPPSATPPTESTPTPDTPSLQQPPPAAAAESPAAPAESTPAPAASLPTPQSPPAAAAESAPAAAPASSGPEAGSAPQQPDSPFELAATPARASLAWQLAAGVLALALGLQIINHYRAALAAHPTLEGPLRTVYGALGVKLAPHWNIHAYDVRQLGASVAGTAAGEIIVRASVMNGADRAQPLPLLRVTLQDRFGNRIAARDVPPGDYLPSPAAPGALLAAGSRVDATMAFVDPGPQAVGFEIDACLPQPNGAVACAHGPE